LIAVLDESRPLFLQVASLLEESILSGAYEEESQVPSVADLSVNLRINPATALKGVNLLVERGLLVKKRGLGMFVVKGARETLRRERQTLFYKDYILPLVEEAKRLSIREEELLEMLRRGVREL